MPDISMCVNSICLSKNYCYRFTAKPTPISQSYSVFTLEDEETSCSYFWPNNINSNNCKLCGVKREGEICNLDHCSYPKCVQDDYCKYCHKTNSNHKMSCCTQKKQINL